MFKPNQKETLMKKNFPLLSIVVVIALFASVYGALVLQAQAAIAAPEAAGYEAVLGKSLSDQNVADFIASNRCAGTGAFQMCNEAGIALLTGQSQTVETVYLYPNKIDDFGAYKGALPLGLSASDTMARVEDKFGQPKVQHAPQAGWQPGLPDASGTPDYIHYWATYRRFGLTIVYNSPSATDKGATIYAILVRK
jgi:hypothetical protein